MVPAQPLPVRSAMTQGQIGHLLTAAFTSTANRSGLPAVCVVTHTVVDPADPAFGNPAKPAAALAESGGTRIIRDSDIENGEATG